MSAQSSVMGRNFTVRIVLLIDLTAGFDLYFDKLKKLDIRYVAYHVMLDFAA